MYALTAYVLNLNDILPADAVLDQDSLPKVKMPNRDGFTTDHGFMRRDGKPDTHNTACMKDCVKEVRLSSEMPDYARDQHGNLAEQVRAVGAAAPGRRQARHGEGRTRPREGVGVHRLPRRDRQGGGAGLPRGGGKLCGRRGRARRGSLAKIKAGGTGVWGSVPMPAQPQVREAEAKALVAVDSGRGPVTDEPVMTIWRTRVRERRMALNFTVIRDGGDTMISNAEKC